MRVKKLRWNLRPHHRKKVEMFLILNQNHKKRIIMIKLSINLWIKFDALIIRIIASILLITISIATHIIDITDHSEYHARIHIRCLSATIIFISIRLLKVGRVVNEQFGVLVITLTSSIRDIGVWFGVFIIFLLPFSKFCLQHSLNYSWCSNLKLHKIFFF